MIIARSVWGAKPSSLPSKQMKLPAKFVFIHHSVTEVTDDPYKDMRGIESVGLQRFNQFSYSYCIHPKKGEILEGCGSKIGAHTLDRNSTSFGICWIGNYNERQPKVQQLDATRWLIGELIAKGWLVPSYTLSGHRDVYSTACPGNKLYSMLDIIRHPWEENVPDDPNIPNLPNIKFFEPVINSEGMCTGYYIVADDGQLHAFGPGAPYHGRSEVPS